jgi:hypothetical protein
MYNHDKKIVLPIDEKQPVPDFLTNGILVYFLYDHRFLFIQKRYSPDKQNWFTRFTRKKPKEDEKNQEFKDNDYYVHSHKQAIKIDSGTVKRKDDPSIKYDTLIPDTDIWIGLLRLPITEGNLRLYYNGKYTSIKSTYGEFLTKYMVGLKSSFVTKTKNITSKPDVVVERWYIYPDIPANQSIFIL